MRTYGCDSGSVGDFVKPVRRYRRMEGALSCDLCVSV